MQITEVRLRLVKDSGRLKATASVTFDESFVVHDLRVVESDGALFIAMPNKKLNNGEFRDVAHPINNEMRDYIAGAVISKYKEEAARASSQTTE